MKAIRATYSYYTGTYNAPEDGLVCYPMTDTPLLFETLQEAKDYLLDDMECEHDGYGEYSPEGIYCTRHGEYARPTYRIVTVKWGTK